MTKRDIRVGHLLSPFGPGSIYTDREGIPFVIAGLDHWFPPGRGGPGQSFDVGEFEIVEPRLSALLKVAGFRRPPDFRAVRRGANAATNSMLRVPVLRFPCWYRNSKSGTLREFNPTTRMLERPTDGGQWRPVRFVAVCESGHLAEFPWKQWSGCTCTTGSLLTLDDRGGADLSSIVVRCRTCSRSRSLSGAMSKPDTDEQGAFDRAGIPCTGARPWLSETSGGSCSSPLVGALINQTNIHFAKVLSSIRLPKGQGEPDPVRLLCTEVLDPDIGGAQAHLLWAMDMRDVAASEVIRRLEERKKTFSKADVIRALEIVWDEGGGGATPGVTPVNAESEVAAARREEHSVLRTSFDDPKVPFLRTKLVSVPAGLAPWIARVVQVERLRETRAFHGFTRLIAKSDGLAGMPDVALHQLFLDPPKRKAEQWLPAVVVHGEGIYLELDENAITAWQARCSGLIASRLNDGFVKRLYDVPQILWPLKPNDRTWASRYLLVHTLAHIIINQLVFECGYSTASLRERLYISADPAAPMAGMLIYTAAGDSDGTLGGLVRQGHPDLLEPMLRRALSRAWWCAADPVCSELLGGVGARRVNLAGCHGCVLLPETSCETINNGLDRAMIVGTPNRRELGFMHELVNDLQISGEQGSGDAK